MKKRKQGRMPGIGGRSDERGPSIPIVEEVLEVGKKTVDTGTTRVTKRIHEREEEIDIPLVEQRVAIDRVPVNRYVEHPVPVRQQDGVTIVSVFEEVLVLEKRLLLKEELHIRTVGEAVHHPRKIMLRREEIDVQHLGPEPTDESRH